MVDFAKIFAKMGFLEIRTPTGNFEGPNFVNKWFRYKNFSLEIGRKNLVTLSHEIVGFNWAVNTLLDFINLT